MAEKIPPAPEPEQDSIAEPSEPRYHPGDYRLRVSVADARKDIEHSLPGFEIVSIENLSKEEEGLSNVPFLVNGIYIFRFARNDNADISLNKEACALPLIEENVDLAVPHLEHTGVQAASGHKFVGYKKIEGEWLRPEIVKSGPEARARFAGQIAKFFSQLHSIDVAKAEAVGIKPRDYSKHYLKEWEEARRYLYGLIEFSYPAEAEQIKAYIEALFPKYLEDASNFDYRPAVLHGDLESVHILYDPAKKDVTGIIDWGAVQIGDPDYDLFRPYSHYGREFIEDLLRTYPHKDPKKLFARMDFFYRAQMIHRTVRSARLKDEENISFHLPRLRKQALGLAYWYEELRDKKGDSE